MEKPPPYGPVPAEGTTSSQVERQPRNSSLRDLLLAPPTNRHLLFVQAMYKSAQIEVHVDEKGATFGKDKPFAYKDATTYSTKDCIFVVPIRFDSKTTFQSLLDDIMPNMGSRSASEEAVKKKYTGRPAATRVSRISVQWNLAGYHAADSHCSTVVFPGEDEYLRVVLQKMKSRDWNDIMVLKMEFEK